MNLPSNEFVYRKRIGKMGSKPVIGIGMIGGLHLVAAQSEDGGISVLGAGSHPGVARHIAKKYAPDVEYDMLEKSEPLQLADFQDILPFWEAVTNKIR